MTKQLKPEFVKLIIKDAELQGKIAAFNNNAPQSVLRWAKERNQKKLTSHGTLQAISIHTGKELGFLTASK